MRYVPRQFTVSYSQEQQQFYMLDDKGVLVGTHTTSGRELGRDAWDMGADVVRYDYDAKLDHDIPLTIRNAQY